MKISLPFFILCINNIRWQMALYTISCHRTGLFQGQNNSLLKTRVIVCGNLQDINIFLSLLSLQLEFICIIYLYYCLPLFKFVCRSYLLVAMHVLYVYTVDFSMHKMCTHLCVFLFPVISSSHVPWLYVCIFFITLKLLIINWWILVNCVL